MAAVGKRLLLVTLALVVAGACPAAWALFGSGGASAAQTVSAGVLRPPTGLTAAQGPCANNRNPSVALSWTPSASPFAAGYAIWRAGGASSSYVMVGTAGGGSAAGFTDTTVAFSTAYRYEVQTLRAGWTSSMAGPVSITTLSRTCH